MESYRLKNIIILILALLNVCLLGILAMRVNAEHASRREAQEQLVSLFASAGVRLDADLISHETPPSALTLTRDKAEEQSLAAYLLGGTPVRSDQNIERAERKTASTEPGKPGTDIRCAGAETGWTRPSCGDPFHLPEP